MLTLEYATAEEISISDTALKKCLRGEMAGDCSALINEVKSCIVPKACWNRFPVCYEGDTVKTEFMCENVAKTEKYMHGCVELILFAATVGFDVDRLIAKNSSTSALKGFVTDAIASIAIEAWCDLLCSRLAKREAVYGKVLLPRFSVGYGGLDLKYQRNICDILQTRDKIGLFLTDSMLMSPQKSVTAIIPVIK